MTAANRDILSRDSLQTRLSFVATQAEMKFHDLSAMWKDGGVLSVDSQCQPRGAVNKPVIPPISFEVSRHDFVIWGGN